MNRPSLLARQLKLFAVAAVGLALLDLWAWQQYESLADAAVLASAETEQASKLVERITTLRQQGAVAAARASSPTDLVRHLELAATHAGISRDHLLRIAPSTPHRAAGSVYVEQPIELTLTDVELSKALAFFAELSASGNGLRVQGLRMIAPRDPAGSPTERWRIDTTVSYWIFLPVSLPTAKADNS